jgi:hypothetical protein
MGAEYTVVSKVIQTHSYGQDKHIWKYKTPHDSELYSDFRKNSYDRAQ